MNRKFGGISERAHSNFELEKCDSLTPIFIDFHEISRFLKFEKDWPGSRIIMSLFGNTPPSGEVIGSPELHSRLFFIEEGFVFTDTNN